MTEFLCAVGVVPTRVYPKSGRISALAGREGRLRACMRDVHWFLLAFISSQILNGVRLEKGIYGHSRFCNTDFDDKLACLNLSGV